MWVDTNLRRDDHQAVANGLAGQLVAEVERLGVQALPYAEAMRNTLRFDAARRSGPRAPGMLVLGPTDDIELSTPGTDALHDLLRYSDPVARSLPASVLIIAARPVPHRRTVANRPR